MVERARPVAVGAVTLLELEPVEHVAGQVPLPQMPDEPTLFSLPPVRRPDGRLYRPRKLPTALLLGEDEILAVAVMRTHDAVRARRLALQELFKVCPDGRWWLGEPELRWGRWRPDRLIDGQTWVAVPDGASGTPAVFFEIEECP